MTSLPMAAIVLLLASGHLTACQPTIAFPFNAQLPLAARIDQSFSYSFSPYTFQSDSAISYSLGQHPDWISVDSESRRIYGTPKDGDVPPGEVVGQAIDIIATDAGGSVSMNATLVVSRQPAPQVTIPLEKQVDSLGNFSAPSSILSYPSAGFKISFDQNTFGRSGLNYYATSADSSPLPAWVKFDGPSLTFTGQTPTIESLVQPPHSFDFKLVASDIVGFSASSLNFSIVVGSHQLTTDHPIITLNATRGSQLTYDGLHNDIKLDGKEISAGDMTPTVNDLPSWLSFDSTTWILEGTPKDGDRTSNFTITFKDHFSDNLDVLVVLNVASGLFKSPFKDLKIRPGSNFDLDLATYCQNPDDVAVKVSTSPNQDWIKVKDLQLSGEVPKLSKGDFKLLIDASSKTSDLRDNEVVGVSFLPKDGASATDAPVSSSTTSTAATSTHADDASPDEPQTQSGRLSTGEILLATIIPIIFVAVLLMMMVCYLRRRRARKGYLSSKYRAKISNPILGTLRVNGSDPSMRESGSMTGTFVHTEPLMHKPPKVAFPADENLSPLSSRRRSSETLSPEFAQEVPQNATVDVARTANVRSISNATSEDGRQSWVTIEGGGGGGGQGGPSATRSRSSRSLLSDTTYPESISAQQIFPGADYYEPQSRRVTAGETTLPTLDEAPSLKPTSLFAAQKPYQSPLSYHSVGRNSAVTTSSAALPHMGGGTYTSTTTGTTGTTSTTTAAAAAAAAAAATAAASMTPRRAGSPGRDASDPNWITLAESESGGDNLCSGTLQRPSAAALATPSRGLGSASGRSVTTEISFGSSENWRIIGRNSPIKTEQSYKDLVDEAPFHPSRPSTARREEQERRSPELMSPSRWGKTEARPSPDAPERWGSTGSNVSKQSSGSEHDDIHMSGGRGHGSGDDWMRQNLGEISEGSFKVFL